MTVRETLAVAAVALLLYGCAPTQTFAAGDDTGPQSANAIAAKAKAGRSVDKVRGTVGMKGAFSPELVRFVEPAIDEIRRMAEGGEPKGRAEAAMQNLAKSDPMVLAMLKDMLEEHDRQSATLKRMTEVPEGGVAERIPGWLPPIQTPHSREEMGARMRELGFLRLADTLGPVEGTAGDYEDPYMGFDVIFDTIQCHRDTGENDARDEIYVLAGTVFWDTVITGRTEMFTDLHAGMLPLGQTQGPLLEVGQAMGVFWLTVVPIEVDGEVDERTERFFGFMIADANNRFQETWVEEGFQAAMDRHDRILSMYQCMFNLFAFGNRDTMLMPASWIMEEAELHYTSEMRFSQISAEIPSGYSYSLDYTLYPK